MIIIEVKNYKELSKKASDLLINEINRRPKLVIGLATGYTFLGFYKNLVGAYKKKLIDFSRIKTFNLDEYYPIKRTDKRSFNYYMNKVFFNKVNIKKININMLNGETLEPKKECLAYEKELRKNPIDIQFLGVGINGHIGFNEPNSNIKSKTRVVKLTESTTKRNWFFTKKQIPDHALTVGIKDILRAKKIVLLASGKDKSMPLSYLINKKINKRVPASYLIKHKNLIVIADKGALKNYAK
jgi:glucosamine-6-phosphate deaminase